MSCFRKLSFLHDGDYISYENKIYKVDWSLKEPNNVICLKTNEEDYIEDYTRVKWLRNYKNLTVVK